MYIVVLLSLLIGLVTISSADSSTQTDWSGGPNTPGPVTSWEDLFESHIQTGWGNLPGSLLLSFAPASHIVSTSLPGSYFVFSADMDGDGDQDILSQSTQVNDIVWYENDGFGGTWTEHIVENNYNDPRCAYPVDLDGDGDTDIVAGLVTSGVIDRIEWWENLDGSGTNWANYEIDDWVHFPWYVCAADMDGDNDQDVVSCGYGPDGRIEWWENVLPSTTWLKHTISYSSPRSTELFPVDLDFDGDMDVLSSCWDQPDVVFWENTDGIGTSWTGNTIWYDIDQAYSICAADVDLDMDLDVLVAAGNSTHGWIVWFENVDGSCYNWDDHVIDGDYLGAYGICAEDLTGDGYVDVVGCSGGGSGLHSLDMWESVDGSGFTWIRHELDQGPWTRDVDLADIDGDDTLDVVGCAPAGTSIKWYKLCYKPSGNLTSSVLDLIGYPEWDQITWTSTEPAGTDVYFQVKASNNPDNMGAWSGYIYDPMSLVGIMDSTYRFIQYRVFLETSERFVTPVLEEISFLWDNMGIEEGEESGIVLRPVVPNPLTGLVTISFAAPEFMQVTLNVYDLSGRLISSVGDEYPEGVHSTELSGLSPGTYFIRMISGDFTAMQRFVVIE